MTLTPEQVRQLYRIKRALDNRISELDSIAYDLATLLIDTPEPDA